jgi:hypothetical protein
LDATARASGTRVIPQAYAYSVATELDVSNEFTFYRKQADNQLNSTFFEVPRADIPHCRL